MRVTGRDRGAATSADTDADATYRRRNSEPGDRTGLQFHVPERDADDRPGHRAERAGTVPLRPSRAQIAADEFPSDRGGSVGEPAGHGQQAERPSAVHHDAARPGPGASRTVAGEQFLQHRYPVVGGSRRAVLLISRDDLLSAVMTSRGLPEEHRGVRAPRAPRLRSPFELALRAAARLSAQVKIAGRKRIRVA